MENHDLQLTEGEEWEAGINSIVGKTQRMFSKMWWGS